MSEQAAGWYNDPYGRFQQRYWDGGKWTEHVATNGVQQVDPLGASTVIPVATPASAYAAPAAPAARGFVAAADPGDLTAQADDPVPAGPVNAVTGFLDSMGDDARLRPRPSLRNAMAGIGGFVLALGLLIALAGDDPKRGTFIAIGLALIAAAWTLRTFVKVPEAQAAAVGAVVVGIPAFGISATISDGQNGFLTSLVVAVLFIAAWALPGFKSRNLLLGLGALALVGALGSLTAPDEGDIAECRNFQDEGDYDAYTDADCDAVLYGESDSFLPSDITNNTGDAGWVYLLSAAALLGGTFWLDRRGYHGTATALGATGLISAVEGTALLAADFGETTGPILVLGVGVLVCVVGSHGSRRATTWWGALMAAVGVTWFVAVQMEPDSQSATGGVAIVSGLVLIGIPLVAAPIRAAMASNNGPGQAPPPGSLAPAAPAAAPAEPPAAPSSSTDDPFRPPSV
ncbi:MAG: DUF2510 domain-containing protein [Actinomycetota bacterium]|nr:DUF2510 domain-containing protein [Actinomycetota bacterium]